MTASPAAAAAPAAPLRGIHHLKVAASRLDRSLAFYENALGARRLPDLDHRHEDGGVYAHILEIPGIDTYLELRHNPDQAARQRRFDFLTLTVDDRAALGRWERHLSALGVAHSPVLASLHAWVLVIEDPDQHRIRLYTAESHGPGTAPEAENAWLGD